MEGFEYAFSHGVASGDPTEDGIVLWTRVTHRNATRALEEREVLVRYEVYEEPTTAGQTQTAAANPIVIGVASALRERDWTVKVMPDGLLNAATKYSYRFSVLGHPSKSPLGHFKTLPRENAHVEEMKYAVFSCSNYGWGLFNAYDAASREDDLDFALHLGDYYYEYNSDTYPDKREAVRWEGLEPQHETMTLRDYRERHAVYRKDSGLQQLTAKTALIAMWDDHEVADNQYTGGANHHREPEDGSFKERKDAAVQAYHEWLPTRSGPFGTAGYVGEKYYRKFEFGDLATLMIMETRMLNRTNPDEKPNLFLQTAMLVGGVEDVFNLPEEMEEELEAMRANLDQYRSQENKTLLSTDELKWIEEETKLSVAKGKKWQLYGNQIIMADLHFASFQEAVEDADNAKAMEWRTQIENAVCRNGTQAQCFDPTPYLADKYLQIEDLSQEYVEGSGLSHCAIYKAMVAQGKFKIPFNLDQWSGYLAERDRFYRATSSSANRIVYSGDSHNAWASNLRSEDGTVLAAEYAGTSVSSSGLENMIRHVSPELVAAGFKAANPDLVYTNTKNRGYMLMSLTHEKHSGSFLYVDNVQEREYGVFCETKLEYPATNSPLRKDGLVAVPCERAQGSRGNSIDSAHQVESTSMALYLIPFIITLAAFVSFVGAFVIWKRVKKAKRYTAMKDIEVVNLSELHDDAL